VATGVRGKEKLSEDAITANRVVSSKNISLPSPEAQVTLTYPEKLDEKAVLSEQPSELVEIARNGLSTGHTEVNPNSFILADNLHALATIKSTIHRASLVYLDPPYGTGMEFQSRGLKHAYKDDKGSARYLEFMRRRLILIRECMADDASLYLHIGHQMLFHLKVILDEVFGETNFQNLIVRRKCSSKNFTRNRYPNLNDYILFYSKSSNFKWNRPEKCPEEAWIEKEYPKVDSRGRYKLVPVHAPGTRNGDTGKPWRNMLPPPGKHWQFSPSKLDEYDKNGEIHWSRNGNPRRKVYLLSDKTLPFTDYWSDFRDAHHQSIRITGYPTEKNLNMLKVIVSSATNPGDIVLDPFCGSGTTLHAAHILGRRWIGIDESFTAAEACVNRLRNGMQPMGDYVKKDSSQSNQQSLFPPPSSGRGHVVRYQASDSAEFSFLVDSTLIRKHPNELSRIASL